jgi:preprotein translocase subunit SecY
VLAIAFALVQGYFIATYLEGLDRGGADVLATHGLLGRLEMTASHAAGTMVLVALAAWIDRRGLGNGYGALLASGWLLEAARWLADDRVHRASLVLGVAAFAAIALVGFALLRWRVDRFRLPACGLVPLSDAFGLAQLVGTLAAFGLLAPTVAMTGTFDWIASHAALMVAAIAAFAVVWSYVFARPSLVGDVAARAGVSPPERRSWWRATAASAAGVLAIGAIAYAASHPRGSAGTIVDMIGLLFTVAVVLDACEDARARRADMVAVWPLHQVQHAELVGDALHADGIAVHLQGSHLRALLAYFWPFAPFTVYVPRADAQAAEARIRAIVLGAA